MSRPKPRPVLVNFAEMLGGIALRQGDAKKTLRELADIEERRLDHPRHQTEVALIRDLNDAAVAVQEAELRVRRAIERTETIRTLIADDPDFRDNR